MRKKSFLFIISFLYVLLSSICINASTLYRCVDQQGNEIATDHLVGGSKCTPMVTYDDISDEEREAIKKEKEEHEKIRDKEYKEEHKNDDIKKQINECSDRAYKRYVRQWNQACKANGKSDGCTLSPQTASRNDQNLQSERSQCIQMYPLRP
jgi:Mg2+ and Co2+ transporter CorA